MVEKVINGDVVVSGVLVALLPIIVDSVSIEKVGDIVLKLTVLILLFSVLVAIEVMVDGTVALTVDDSVLKLVVTVWRVSMLVKEAVFVADVDVCILETLDGILVDCGDWEVERKEVIVLLNGKLVSVLAKVLVGTEDIVGVTVSVIPRLEVTVVGVDSPNEEDLELKLLVELLIMVSVTVPVDDSVTIDVLKGILVSLLMTLSVTVPVVD